jgi:hypothetical protein
MTFASRLVLSSARAHSGCGRNDEEASMAITASDALIGLTMAGAVVYALHLYLHR